MLKKLIILSLISLIISAVVFKQKDNRYLFEQIYNSILTTVTGGRVSLANDGQMLITNTDDNQTTSLSSDLPENFPASFPVYPGAKIALAASQIEESSLSVRFDTNYSIKDVASFYQRWLKKKKWKLTVLTNEKGKFRALVDNKVWQGSLIISRYDNQTFIDVDLYR